MNEMKTATVHNPRRRFARWFSICPVRHVLFAVGLLLTTLYFILRENTGVMRAVYGGFISPYYKAMGRLCSLAEFSVGEVLCCAAILALLVYIIFFITKFIGKSGRGRRVYKFLFTLAAAAALIYGLFCWLWGVCYYSNDFSYNSGIIAGEVNTNDLEIVTKWFALLANEYGAQVSRNEAGVFSEDTESIFDKSVTLYEQVQERYTSLRGPALRAKPVYFSKFMSWINFTGFFFSLTGEANLNVDSPSCMLPSTIAHELAHQRGVAAEDEANFVAVLACFENGDPVYCYSAALLGYIHLGNALHAADYDRWLEAYSLLDDDVITDFRYKNAYWASYETKAAEAYEAVYEGFLKSYGEEDGMKSYGKCVDLLVAYYIDEAAAALGE